MSVIPTQSPTATEVDADAAPLASAPPHIGTSIDRYVSMLVVGLLFPLACGLLLYGWRAAGTICTVLISTYVATRMWQRVGRRGYAIDMRGAMVSALLLSLLLPAHLLALTRDNTDAPWPILPAAAFTMVSLMWLLGGSWRIHSVLLTFLLLVVPFQLLRNYLAPQFVLQNTRLLVGDLLHAADAPVDFASAPWFRAGYVEGADALRRRSVASQLSAYTLALEKPDRAWTSMQTLVRDRLPPLEDLIVGGLPGPIGCGSAVGIVIGGLFLLYRGLIDWRIPLLTVLFAWLAILVLPVPIVITERAPVWQWLAFRESAATWGVAITFANYEILAGPLLFVAFFLATAPSIRPMARRWRTVWAIALGLAAAAAQLYVSASVGPIIALATMGLLTPLCDRRWKSS